MNIPLISIITPCLNRVEFVAKAVESVLAQNFASHEHIIVDGGSVDGTLEILSRYPRLKVVSEPDQGMYDAINKGLALARGEWIGFLNTDDLYAPAVFREIAQFTQDETVLACVGRAEIFREESDRSWELVDSFSPVNQDLLMLSTLDSPYFNAWFFRRSVFQTIGNLEGSYRIVADREFMLRFALSGLKYVAVDKLFYQYCQHSGALTFCVDEQKLEQIVMEHMQLTERYLKQPNLPRHAARLIRQARTQDTLEMAIHAFRGGDLRKMFFFMMAGMRYDLVWAVKLGKEVFGKLVKSTYFRQGVN